MGATWGIGICAKAQHHVKCDGVNSASNVKLRILSNGSSNPNMLLESPHHMFDHNFNTWI